ncbi:MAG TPA: helix-turn-helix transcriptional regulator [Pedomonas sp.]|uniref:helix-turn-helix domain-containing protein n=1 Tax=Pedomonas sp. TaxID=2976421 RepID=UPI002F3FC56D
MHREAKVSTDAAAEGADEDITGPAGQKLGASSHRQSRLLKEVLKQQIRIRGLRYQDIADQLGVSVVTIKRYLNSDRLPVEVMEDISACLGLSLIDLSEIAKEGDGRNFLDLELRQESALASDSALALMRLMLYSGMTVPEIMSEYAVDEATVISLLTRLDRLKLIELLPGNRVRIPGPHHIEWKPGGPIRRTIEHNIRNHFVMMDFANTEDFYGYETVRLSRESVRQLEEHMRQLVRQVRVLHRLDQGIPSADKQWHTLLVAQRETNWGFPVDNGETLLPRRSSGPTFPAVAEPPAV